MKHDTRMRMTITLSDYKRLPLEDKHDPSVLWHILIDDKGQDTKPDWDNDWKGGSPHYDWGA